MKFKIHRLDRVGSTNKHSFKLCQNKKAKEGEVFLAYEQFDGRGYHSNSWLTKPGKNLTFSLILEPDFILPSRQFVITQFVSLAIVDLLHTLIKDETINIKWPNDIYINDLKAGGILVQNTIIGNAFEYAIIGIGLNVNQREFPPEVPNPASIISFIDEDLELDSLLTELLTCINKRYEQLMLRTDLKILEQEYLNHLYRFNELATFKDLNGRFTGRISGMGEFGELLIIDETGRQRKYNFKEIEFDI
ncbi:MAG: biotin--[acetyl-CoA-carboxylase] ligase [Bacteroidales bacterium]|jgi:BirA family biotin operon repressor/biotin-[acetyl-CoA-carboxylase] ligase|nr:biotin--[acetyl-CoA-carboxylase] ligase [Bacteroidales bacterium]